MFLPQHSKKYFNSYLQNEILYVNIYFFCLTLLGKKYTFVKFLLTLSKSIKPL